MLVADELAQRFLHDHPKEAAAALNTMSSLEVLTQLSQLEPSCVAAVLNAMAPHAATAVLMELPSSTLRVVLNQEHANLVVPYLAALEPADQEEVLSVVDERRRGILQRLLQFPESTAGRIMETAFLSLAEGSIVADALESIRNHPALDSHRIKLVDGGGCPTGFVDSRQLLLKDASLRLIDLRVDEVVSVAPMASHDDVAALLRDQNRREICVVDAKQQLLGVISQQRFADSLRDEATLDIQTMVGVSKDERASSNTWFAVRKRMPWLQVNLVTAFVAAAAVGVFEDVIAQMTALAVLLPVVAGQSGNSGSQALAVTLRGLALREVSLSDWWSLVLKELSAGILNGLSVAVVCGIAVYFWSSSWSLVAVISSSMVVSMVVAGLAGASIPMLMEKLGQDPAVASTIVLTTVTDVVGFFVFLGSAALYLV